MSILAKLVIYSLAMSSLLIKLALLDILFLTSGSIVCGIFFVLSLSYPVYTSYHKIPFWSEFAADYYLYGANAIWSLYCFSRASFTVTSETPNYFWMILIVCVKSRLSLMSSLTMNFFWMNKSIWIIPVCDCIMSSRMIISLSYDFNKTIYSSFIHETDIFRAIK